MSGARPKARAEAPGLTSRVAAARALHAILQHGHPLDDAIGTREFGALPLRDRALAHMLVATVLRRLGTLRALIGECLDSGLPKDAPHVEIALLLGAAQILFLDVPDHAAVDLSVHLASSQRKGRYAGLANAVLRRIARDGRGRLSNLDPLLDTPSWLLDRWQRTYGRNTASAIALAHRHEPPLDLSVKDDPSSWAERLGGRVLPTGTVRLAASGPITALPGFAGGAWWVQDVAASLPARLLGDVSGRFIADLCAAPGGKTAQLAAAGARVVAVDRSATRLKRLNENLARLSLKVETVVADLAEWSADPFDAVLLDAPCSATGTIRRRPDVPWRKRPEDIAALASIQEHLLDRAAALTRPGGLLVYATCSLEPEEGEHQIGSFLARHTGFARLPVAPDEVGGVFEFVSPAGDLRTLPCHLPDSDPRFAGCDGFYSARLQRLS